MITDFLPKNKPILRISDGQKVIIHSIVHYPGTEQLVIDLSTGFGASEKRERTTISEHDAEKFKQQFDLPTKKETYMETSNAEVIENNKDNFNEVRSILFDTMRGLKDGTVKPDIAKQISETAQTIINTVKVELDYVKISGENKKPKMLS